MIVEERSLIFHLNGRAKVFTANLFRSIEFSNSINYDKLELVFPGHVYAWKRYKDGQLGIDLDDDNEEMRELVRKLNGQSPPHEDYDEKCSGNVTSTKEISDDINPLDII